MRALEGWRVVADPAAIDAIAWTPDGDRPPTLIRSAPDEIFAIDVARPTVDDAFAIIEHETGFAGTWGWSIDELRAHIEWSIPVERPVMAQGSVAGVPARLRILEDDRVLVVVAVAHAAVFVERLGSRP